MMLNEKDIKKFLDELQTKSVNNELLKNIYDQYKDKYAEVLCK